MLIYVTFIARGKKNTSLSCDLLNNLGDGFMQTYSDSRTLRKAIFYKKDIHFVLETRDPRFRENFLN